MSATVVVGGGLHGMAAAALCARAGRDVVLLEASEQLGGLATLVAGPVRVNRELIGRLGLEQYGVALRERAEPVFLPEPVDATNGGLLLDDDSHAGAAEIAAHSERDAAQYERWREWLGRIGDFVRGVLDAPPPDPFSSSPRDLFSLAKTATRLRRLGSDDMLELLRVVPMCAADWMGEWFETPLLSAGLAARGCRGGVNGPWAPHTAGLLLLQECAGSATIQDRAILATALARCCEAAGVHVRTGAPVAEIRVARGRVEGVRLDDGESIDASAVLSAADPKTTLLGLVPPRHLEPRLLHELEAYRMRGTTALVRLALSSPLAYRCRPDASFARASLTGDLDDLERAFDPIKYGASAERPWLEVHWSGDQMTIEAHCAPYELAGGWTDERREAFGDAVVAQLRRYAELPDAAITAREVWTPPDIEREYRVTGGHVLHGEPALDQLLFLRPAVACSRYATPIEGLWLCGPGSHPGTAPVLGSADLAVRVLGS